MLEIIAIALLSGLTTFIGVWLATKFSQKKNYVVFGIGFSVGVMLALSFLELLPNAVVQTTEFLVAVSFGLGFAVVLLFDFLLPHTHFLPEKGQTRRLVRMAYLVAIGIIIHDFPEGFAMASAYTWNAAAGLLVAVAVALHNIPEEFALSVPLVLTGKKKLLYKLAAVSALAEPLGAIFGLSLFFLLPALSPLMMAFAAGAMVFVSIDELLPLARKYGRKKFTLLGFLLGAIVYALLAALV